MAYNRPYNNRYSGRYNTPGQFVSAGETFGNTPRKQQQQNMTPVQTTWQPPLPPQPQSQPQPEPQPQPQPPMQEEDVAMDSDMASNKDDDGNSRPHWMKNRLQGVKKVSNKERRRRQNENLRRLLTPKNALMVLNEMMPCEQVANQFKVEPSTNAQYYKSQNTPSFCADLTIEGNVYKGYGDNKLMARNAAAEQAIRDLIIKKMNKVLNSDGGSTTGSTGGTEEESLPMIQLASFALHKLFTEWEYEGHKVPQLKPTTTSTSEPPQEPKGKAKELPANARQMHPCMLLTYMRPYLEYRELAATGDRPQNMLFTMGVDVDGATYIGKASNKKEARKAAAKAACQAVFNIEFEPNACANTPIPPQ